jgi:uncharacterized protein YcfL
MKKIALVAVATLALAACTGNTETNEAANDTADYNLTTENAIEDVNAAAVDAQNAADVALDNAAASIDNAGEAVENTADAIEANVE